MQPTIEELAKDVRAAQEAVKEAEKKADDAAGVLREAEDAVNQAYRAREAARSRLFKAAAGEV